MNREVIRKEIEKMGYRQKDVASEIGVNYHTYRKKENGKVSFSTDEKIKLAKLLKWTPYEMNVFLFDGKLPINEDGTAGW